MEPIIGKSANINKHKKIVLSASLLITALGVLGIAIISDKEIFAKISLAIKGAPPAITNAFLDKEKYFPGDMMTITAETENADSTKAFVENEKGFNEANLVVSASFNGKETWTGKWKVVDSTTGKKYKLKIVASNKSGAVEKVLEWEDPSNPGHPASSIDPGIFAAGDFTFPNKLTVNDNFTVANGKSISLGGVAKTSWPVFSGISCTMKDDNPRTFAAGDTVKTPYSGSCPAGTAIVSCQLNNGCSATKEMYIGDIHETASNECTGVSRCPNGDCDGCSTHAVAKCCPQ